MIRGIAASLVCVVFLGLTGAEGVSSDGGDLPHSGNAPAFHVRTTEHFSLHYKTNEETANELVPHMESTYRSVWEFCQDLKLAVRSPGERLLVYLFDDGKDYHAFCEKERVKCDGVQGTYAANRNVVVLLNILRHEAMVGLNASGMDAGNPRLIRERDAIVKSFNRLVVRHEVAHQVFFNIGALNREAVYPDWLLEGLACLFEPEWAGNPKGEAVLNQDRLADLRSQLKATSTQESDGKKRLSDDRAKLLTLRTVAGNPEAIAESGQLAVYRYAQAWATTCYLHVKKKDQLAGYLAEMSGRGSARMTDAAEQLMFEHHFGPLNEGADQAFQTFLFQCLEAP